MDRVLAVLDQVLTDIETKYFAPDKGHTVLTGAELNAVCVVEGIRALTACPLSKYLVEMDKPAPDKK